MLKRILACGLAAALTLFLLAGCGAPAADSGTSGSVPVDTEAPDAREDQSAPDGSSSGETEENGAPLMELPEGVDGECLARIEGSYETMDEHYSYFSMYIVHNEQPTEKEDSVLGPMSGGDKFPTYFNMYDSAAGNPGVEGPIVALDEKQFTIDTSEMGVDLTPPSKWQPDEQGLLTLEYTRDEETDGLTLSCGGLSIEFHGESFHDWEYQNPSD